MSGRAAPSRAAPVALAALIATLTACEDAPSVFLTHGTSAGRVATLGWLLTLIASAVTLIVAAVLLVALLRSRPAGAERVQRSGPTVRWIVIGGIVVPAMVLVIAFGFTMFTQSAVALPPSRPVATIRVTGHRWWWEVEYLSDTASETVVTANEIHVPVGHPVRLELVSDDVIHSFWVPELAGKTDLIPGQHNTMWMEAELAGVYRGACAEYCGLQHAHMAFLVVADSPADYEAWLAAQRRSAVAPSALEMMRGLAVFRGSSCAACHAIRGTDARGRAGPDLTHLASRRTLAAGTLPNTRGDLAGWVANAQALKPGTTMPTMALAPRDLRALLTYLESLK